MVTVSVWDFAGQEIYYTTHQFFLSRRSLYLLLFNLCNAASETRVEFWLQSLKTRVPNADVIIVGTHAEDPSLGGMEKIDQRMTDLKTKYKKLFPKFTLSVMAVSSIANINIDQLRETVETQMCKQRHMGEKFPRSYIALEQILHHTKTKMQIPLISLSHLKSIGQMVGHMDPDQTVRAAGMLHDMGSIIYFRNEPGLSHMVILDPTWLTKMMATLFTTKHSWVKKGTIQHSALAQIWREYPQEIYSSLLFLLQKFEICYQLDNDIVEVLLPLLPPFFSPPPLLPLCLSSSSSLLISSQSIMHNLGLMYIKPSAGGDPTSSEPAAPSPPASPDSPTAHPSSPALSGLSTGEILELQAPPFDPFGVSLVPALLPPLRPDEEIQKHWAPFPHDQLKQGQEGRIEQIDRTYTFSFMPKGFFSRLVVKMFPHAQPVAIWASGMLARATSGHEQDWILVGIILSLFLDINNLLLPLLPHLFRTFVH